MVTSRQSGEQLVRLGVEGAGGLALYLRVSALLIRRLCAEWLQGPPSPWAAVSLFSADKA